MVGDSRCHSVSFFCCFVLLVVRVGVGGLVVIKMSRMEGSTLGVRVVCGDDDAG